MIRPNAGESAAKAKFTFAYNLVGLSTKSQSV